MKRKKEEHSFHIPVMGLGFTVDSPVKVAHYGISSVISIVDDLLMEKMRKFYSNKLKIHFEEISEKIEDFRAKRTTAYLNLVDKIVKDNIENLKSSINEKGGDIEKFLGMLPDSSTIKNRFHQIKESMDLQEAIKWVKEQLTPGSIDVNIMTKVDKANKRNGEQLPVEYNDAHAALRGFANSNLDSSLVLSAGMNPRLYSYIENFDGFYPDKDGHIEKKIILKVSDYRSALIQGKFLAKKGIWVSEYRIESGLNCGGHAFATNGYLMGPILKEFRDNREFLLNSVFDLLRATLETKRKPCPEEPLELKITAQGGVGTAEEHEFLLDHYKVDSVGWGSPFLLVPEVTNVEHETMSLLSEAEENDLYLSNISPLGVPFNSLRGNTKDLEKLKLVEEGKPGSPCTVKYLISNTEFTNAPICTASRSYQKLKIRELGNRNLNMEQYQEEFDKIIDKSCLCVGLGESALLTKDLETKPEEKGVLVCPGPNIAYFSEIVSLKKMIDHIYGRINIIKREDRPHMFIKELSLYIDHLKEKIREIGEDLPQKKLESIQAFQDNLEEGISYYRELFNNIKGRFEEKKTEILEDLGRLENEISQIKIEIKVPVPVMNLA
ncbi:hypothetical protein ACFLU5_01415 [Bacteroidota bacterium]